MGRLYAVDMRLRPTGGSGSLAVALAEFQRYYAGGGAQVWERQALTKARTVVGEPAFRAVVEDAARGAAFGTVAGVGDPGAGLTESGTRKLVEEVRSMRERLEAGHSRDLNRGVGGLVDVELVVTEYARCPGCVARRQTADRRGTRRLSRRV
jgi:glutamate-ammonia-ligase adenylyltransferase